MAELRKVVSQLASLGVDLIVLPESSWPYLWDRGMRQVYPRGHPWEIPAGGRAALLIGTLSHDFGRTVVYNSAVLVERQRAIAGIYDKRRLLPMAEKMSEWMQEWFPQSSKEWRQRTPEWPDLIAGTGDAILTANGWHIGVYLCSEDLSGDVLGSRGGLRPQFLVSLANDAWFESGVGAYQHLALASFRAIEERRPLVRATNTGYSGFFDSLGRLQLAGLWRTVTGRGGPVAFETFHAEVRRMEAPSLGPVVRLTLFYIAIAVLLIASVLARASAAREANG